MIFKARVLKIAGSQSTNCVNHPEGFAARLELKMYPTYVIVIYP
jgi:hypothetical protein